MVPPLLLRQLYCYLGDSEAIQKDLGKIDLYQTIADTKE